MMKEFVDDRFSIRLDDGIVYVEWFSTYITYDIVNDGIKIRKDISSGDMYPMLSDIRKVKSGSREARQRLSDKDAGEGISAVAVLIQSKTHRILYNFFTSIYKDPSPTRLFTDEAEALKWLQQFKK
jgi:hypothetical protein